MEKGFCMGLILGIMGGALIVANSKNACKMVRQGQNEIKKNFDNFADKIGEDKNED